MCGHSYRPSTPDLLFTPLAVGLHLVAMVSVAQTFRQAAVGVRGAEASQPESHVATVFTLENKPLLLLILLLMLSLNDGMIWPGRVVRYDGSTGGILSYCSS